MKRFYLEPLRQKGIVPIYCTGTNWMSFIHLSDCARMIIHFAEAGKSGIVCNIVSGVNVRQNEFAELLGNITGAPVRRISAYAVTSRYGRAAAEAFEFSLRASTVHEDMVKNFKLLYPGLKLMLEDILSTCR